MLPGSSMAVFSQCPHVEEGMRDSLEVSVVRLHSHDLITAQRPYLLILLHWGLGFNVFEF